MRSGIVQSIYRCDEPYRRGQHFRFFFIYFFAEIESFECPDLRPCQVKPQLCFLRLTYPAVGVTVGAPQKILQSVSSILLCPQPLSLSFPAPYPSIRDGAQATRPLRQPRI